MPHKLTGKDTRILKWPLTCKDAIYCGAISAWHFFPPTSINVQTLRYYHFFRKTTWSVLWVSSVILPISCRERDSTAAHCRKHNLKMSLDCLCRSKTKGCNMLPPCTTAAQSVGGFHLLCHCKEQQYQQLPNSLWIGYLFVC